MPIPSRSIPGFPPFQTPLKTSPTTPLKMFSVPNLGESRHSPALSFTETLIHMGKQTRDTLVSAEKLSKAAAIGTADPQVVAMSVVNASATVKQFSSFLTSATRAFQELMHTAM